MASAAVGVAAGWVAGAGTEVAVEAVVTVVAGEVTVAGGAAAEVAVAGGVGLRVNPA